jgi:hypothetical protein
LSIPRRIELALLCALLLGACGDKVPESEAARKIGMQPKQTVDRVTTDVNKNLQQGAERTREAEEKK